MEVEWKFVSRIEISWNWNGTRVEVDFYSGNTVEGSGPYRLDHSGSEPFH